MQIRKMTWLALFTTALFQECEWVRKMCAQGGSTWVTDTVYPFGHFGTYFGAVGLRSYDNKYLQDLYYLHELVHSLNFNYAPDQSMTDWARRMFDGEFEASLQSECMAYFHMPSLREKVFTKQELWVDRFLKESVFRFLPIRVIEVAIRTRRMKVYTHTDVRDPLELQIQAYIESNKDWLGIFCGDVGYGPFGDEAVFRVIERHMVHRGEPHWDAEHQQWIESLLPSTDILIDGSERYRVPFMLQAAAFEQCFLRSSNRFGNKHFVR